MGNMARLNRLPLAMAVLSALMASQANALGLGDITLHSSLNQPLDAEIELLQVGDLSADELIAHLANASTFERMGVERSMFLQDLRFTPVIRGGRSYIRVVSNHPVREPYLNFLLELERPSGRLLREYTVLLDPPGYGAAGAGSYGSNAYAPAKQGSRAASERAPRPRATPPRPAAAPIAAGEGRYTTVSGDTLWSIAGRLASDASERQTLMAQLQQLNPQAFVAGNPHRLKRGQTLVLPAGKGASAPVPAPVAAPAANSLANVPATKPAAAGAPLPVDTAATLNQAEGQLAGATAEREQLNQRMDNLQQQLTSLQQALAQRDQQVQSLQAELSRRQAAEQAAAPAPAAATQPAKPAEPVAAPPAASPVAAPEAANGSRQWPWMAGAGVLLVLLGGLFYKRRRPLPVEEPPRVQPPVTARPSEPVVAAVRAPVVAKPTVVAVPAADASLAKLPAASSDSLEGANIYIAYGRFGQARDMLLKSIAAEPQRRDLRMKLLLVLAELGDSAAFHEQEKALLEMGGEQKQIDQLKGRYPAMLERPSEVPSSDDLGEWEGLELGEVLESSSPSEQQPMLGDAELNLGELSLDLDWSSLDAFDSARGQSAKAEPQTERLEDFRSNLRELPEVTEFDLDGEHADAFGLPGRHDSAASVEHDKLLASLDQARACIDRGDLDQAYSILKRVLQDGDSEERAEARELLARIA